MNTSNSAVTLGAARLLINEEMGRFLFEAARTQRRYVRAAGAAKRSVIAASAEVRYGVDALERTSKSVHQAVDTALQMVSAVGGAGGHNLPETHAADARFNQETTPDVVDVVVDRLTKEDVEGALEVEIHPGLKLRDLMGRDDLQELSHRSRGAFQRLKRQVEHKAREKYRLAQFKQWGIEGDTVAREVASFFGPAGRIVGRHFNLLAEWTSLLGRVGEITDRMTRVPGLEEQLKAGDIESARRARMGAAGPVAGDVLSDDRLRTLAKELRKEDAAQKMIQLGQKLLAESEESLSAETKRRRGRNDGELEARMASVEERARRNLQALRQYQATVLQREAENPSG